MTVHTWLGRDSSPRPSSANQCIEPMRSQHIMTDPTPNRWKIKSRQYNHSFLEVKKPPSSTLRSFRKRFVHATPTSSIYILKRGRRGGSVDASKQHSAEETSGVALLYIFPGRAFCVVPSTIATHTVCKALIENVPMECHNTCTNSSVCLHRWYVSGYTI